MEVDLALSGSSTKFPSHIGFLEAIDFLEFKPKRIAGNSGGALVGGLYAAGYTPQEIWQITVDQDFSDFVSLNWKGYLRAFLKGFASNGSKFLELLIELVGKTKFKDIKTPLFLMASNVTLGKLEIFSQETTPDLSLALGIYISSCMPGVFQPVELQNGHSYRDGGMYKDFPIDIWDDHPRLRVGHLVAESRIIPKTKSWNGIDELLMIFNRLVDANVDTAIEHIKDPDNTLIVKSDGLKISSLEFVVDKHTKYLLKQQGYNNTIDLLRDLK